MKKAALLFVVAILLGAGGVSANPVPDAPAVKAVTRCEPLTGSLIARAPDAEGRCEEKAPFTRSYSQEDIERTGQIDLDRALSLLDPAYAARNGR